MEAISAYSIVSCPRWSFQIPLSLLNVIAIVSLLCRQVIVPLRLRHPGPRYYEYQTKQRTGVLSICTELVH